MKYRTIRNGLNFLKTASTALSYLLHPLLMPTLIFAFIFFFCETAVNLNTEVKLNILWVIFITTFLFPFLSTVVLFYLIKKSFSITHLIMEDNRERFYPFLFTGFFYLAITYMFIKAGLDPNIIFIMGGISLSAIIVSLITYSWKISAHAVGICGALGYVLAVGFYYPYEMILFPVAVIVLLIGLLLSARLYLNAHTPPQVFAGAALGFIVSVGSFVLFRKFGLDFIY
jgi:hypothetical protein